MAMATLVVDAVLKSPNVNATRVEPLERTGTNPTLDLVAAIGDFSSI